MRPLERGCQVLVGPIPFATFCQGPVQDSPHQTNHFVSKQEGGALDQISRKEGGEETDTRPFCVGLQNHKGGPS